MTEWEEFVNHVCSKCNLIGKPGYRNFQKWMMSKESLGNHFFDSLLWYRAYSIGLALKDDNDHVTLICGLEGTGKSTLAMQLGAAVSSSFSAHHICYEQNDFFSAIETAQPGDSIILDEGALFLFSREASMEGNRKTVKLLTVCRQLRLHLIVCVPSFWAVDSYVRQHRASTLLLVRKRGSYVGYNRGGIKIITAVGSSKKSILKIKTPDGTMWGGHFNKQFPIINDLNEDAYKKIKSDHMKQYLHDLRAESGSEYMLISQFQKRFPLSRKALIAMVERGDLAGRKLGKKWFIHRDAKPKID